MQDFFKNQFKAQFARDFASLLNRHLKPKNLESVRESFSVLDDLKNELKEKMQNLGISDRWPAILAVFEEVLPISSLPLAQLLAKYNEPLLAWVPHEIKQLDDNQVEIKLKLAPHLILNGSWDPAVISGTALLPLRWLLEKHAPPGQLNLKIRKLEIQFEPEELTDKELFIRTSVATDEIETFIQDLLTTGKSVFESQVSFYNFQQKRKAQAHLTVDCFWNALLSESDDIKSDKHGVSTEKFESTSPSDETKI